MSYWGWPFNIAQDAIFLPCPLGDYISMFSPLVKKKEEWSGPSGLTKPTRPKINANKRIGPHNKDILSIIFGTLLGDGIAELRNNGTRIRIYQEDSHSAYLLWLHNIVSNLGYCSETIPEIRTRLGKGGKIRRVIRFNTWIYSSLTWIHGSFYVDGIKIVPTIISDYLDDLALAIWIMDNGGKVSSGLKLSTNSFTYSDCQFLVSVLFENFGLKASVHSAGYENQYNIYIWKESMPLLREIVSPYIHPSMKYKIS